MASNGSPRAASSAENAIEHGTAPLASSTARAASLGLALPGHRISARHERPRHPTVSSPPSSTGTIAASVIAMALRCRSPSPGAPSSYSRRNASSCSAGVRTAPMVGRAAASGADPAAAATTPDSGTRRPRSPVNDDGSLVENSAPLATPSVRADEGLRVVAATAPAIAPAISPASVDKPTFRAPTSLRSPHFVGADRARGVGAARQADVQRRDEAHVGGILVAARAPELRVEVEVPRERMAGCG